ncbi:MAG: HNH endonuclease [Bdellovibrio sp.]
MNLEVESDSKLILETEKLVRDERELLTLILRRFREIERRRLYSSLGYGSLFECAVKKFGYSEDQAYRRIAAMRLLRELPQMEARLESGEISLSHLGIAQSLFRQEQRLCNQFTSTKKMEVIDKMAGKPMREAQRLAHSYSSSQPSTRTDQVSVWSVDRTEIRFVAPREVEKKIAMLRGYLAHKRPHWSLGHLFDRLCDLGLKEWAPSASRQSLKQRLSENSVRVSRRELFLRAQNKCEKCSSTFALEVDHIQPRALGGTSEPANLRVLCRSCNQRAAVQVFGVKKMEKFLEGTS